MLTKLNNLNILSFLVLIFPLSLVTGPLIPEVIIFFLFLSLLYTFAKEKKFYYFNNNIFRTFIIFYLYLNISSTLAYFNYDNLYSFKSSIFYFRYGILVYAVLYALENNPKLIKFFYIIYVFIFLILFLDELKQVITGVNFFNIKLINGRASSFFGDKLVLDSFLIKQLPIFIAICFFLKKNDLIILIFIFFFGIAIFFGGSRAAFFSYIFFIFSTSFFFFKLRIYFFLFAISLLLFFAIGFSKIDAGKRIFFSTIDQIFPKKNEIFIFSARHQAHYETALYIFKKHPFFGAGPNQFRYLCDLKEFAPIKTLQFKYIYLPSNSTFKLHIIDTKGKIIAVNLELLAKNNINNSYAVIDIIKKTLINENFILDFDLTKHKLILNIYSQKNLQFLKSHMLSHDDLFYLRNEYFVNDKLIEFTKFKKTFDYENGCNTHPHNFHIQLLSEIGIIGYFFLIWFLSILIKKIYFNIFNRKIYSNYNSEYIVSIGILINFFPFMPTGNFFNNWLSFLIFFPLGFYLYFLKKSIK